MNELVRVPVLEDVPDAPPDEDVPAWELKKLKPKHIEICSLLSQGHKNIEIAALVGVTPQYITALLRQPLIKDKVQYFSSLADVRLEALTVKSVDVIADVMKNGDHSNQLRAARLQLEATKRIGRPDPNKGGQEVDGDRLLKLSEQLVGLLHQQKGKVYEGEFTKESSHVRLESYGGSSATSQEDGRGY